MKTTEITRRDWLKSAGTSALVGAMATSAADGVSADDKDRVLDIGSRKQLFVDDFLIAAKEGVRRVLNQPQKASERQPLLEMDQPWEQPDTPILGGVLHDGRRFRMWYRGGGSGPRGGTWCYAESNDGLHWTKPPLGLHEHEGSRKNNIYVLGQPQAFTPFLDPNEKDPARTYKSAINTVRIDTGLAHSPDGLRWTPYRNGAAITGRASDTISQVLWDPFAKVYRLYTRTDYGTGKTGEVRGTRDMVAAADADLSNPKSWRTVREWCLGWERGDRTYHRRRQLYSVNGWIHEGVQFALIWALENGDGERMNAYLATTRGEEPWNLEWIYGNRPLIVRGKPGHFDCEWIQPAPSIVTVKDRHWLYYVGRARTHAGVRNSKLVGPRCGIGLATIRRDGFVSLSATRPPATVTTRLVQFAGDRLEINGETRKGGHIRVALLDRDRRSLPGYSLAECQAFTGDSLAHTVRWKRGPDLSRLAGKPVRVHFGLADADLYALRFTKSS